ncbi:MAG: hypothetical protein BWX88_04548 [Planctomycetes bacterium ADurb.Bin126]|nr:MAG: hypothetical protein BWX88_04548 [Planctomycetes bacterium ADurb.Bin126]
MNGHMRILTFLCLCGWLAVAGAAAQAAGAGIREFGDRYHNSANYGICPRIPL